MLLCQYKICRVTTCRGTTIRKTGGIVKEGLEKKYIPMTETTYYTLLALLEPRHGYAIMQFVEQLTRGRIRLGTGTLYTMVGRLVEDEVIEILSSESGKKVYQITEFGKQLLIEETGRLEIQLSNGKEIMEHGGKCDE